MKKRTTRFRELLARPELLILPGAHDALGARLAEAAGFEALVSGGYSASATLLGAPDTSQLSYTEMADYYARLCDATELPLLADADTGFGGVANVVRTVRGYERAGVAALLLEDQVFPKKCGHYAGKRVVPRAEWLGKLKAALDARTDPDLVIVARTDAVAPHGIDEAIERAQLAREAGCDMVFADALETVEQMRRFCTETGEGPTLANMIEGGKTPELSAQQLHDLGFAAALHALAPTYAVAHALQALYQHLRRDGHTRAMRDRQVTFTDFNAMVGLPQHVAREQQADEEAARVIQDWQAGRPRPAAEAQPDRALA
jgi:methylisocitrate lyase